VEGNGTMNFLSNKLSNIVEPTDRVFTQTCLFSLKGKVVDQVGVAVKSPTQAYLLLTSPGHASSALFKRLDPLIFPVDQGKLTEYEFRIITVLSAKLQDVEDALTEYVMPIVGCGSEW